MFASAAPTDVPEIKSQDRHTPLDAPPQQTPPPHLPLENKQQPVQQTPPPPYQ